MKDFFERFIFICNVISYILVVYNYFAGNEIAAIFQAVSANFLLTIIIFGEMAFRNKG